MRTDPRADSRMPRRIGGNPVLYACGPGKVQLARQDAYMTRLAETKQDWMHMVRRLHPVLHWLTPYLKP